MKRIDTMLLELGDDINNANIVKTLILTELLKSNRISKTVFDTYNEKWQVIIYKNSWFKKILDKEKRAWYYKFVKIF